MSTLTSVAAAEPVPPEQNGNEHPQQNRSEAPSNNKNSKASPTTSARTSPTRAEETLYAQATQALDAGNTPRAYQLFLALWRKRPNYDTALALGYVEMQLGNYRDAVEHFRYALRVLPITQREAQQAKLLALLSEASQRVAHIEWRTTPADTRVYWRKQLVQPPLVLSPGPHRLTLNREGFRPKTIAVMAEAGKTQRAHWRLKALPPADSAGSPANASGSAGGGDAAAPASPHKLSPHRESLHSYETVRQPAVLWVGGGLALASAGVALWLDRSASQLARSGPSVEPDGCVTTPNDPKCVENAKNVNSAQNRQDLALGFFAGAAGVAVGTLATYFLWTETKPIELQVGWHSGVWCALSARY